jgi:hypothetical protein
MLLRKVNHLVLEVDEDLFLPHDTLQFGDFLLKFEHLFGVTLRFNYEFGWLLVFHGSVFANPSANRSLGDFIFFYKIGNFELPGFNFTDFFGFE